METLNSNIGLFQLQIGEGSPADIQFQSEQRKHQLTFTDIVNMKQNDYTVNDTINESTIINYTYENDLKGDVFVNLDHRWNHDSNKLDSWYTIHIVLNKEYITCVLCDIGKEELLFRWIEKLIKQAEIEIKRMEDTVIVF